MTGDAHRRPLPEPSLLSEPFWAAAAQGRLLIPYCADEGLAFFPPELATPGAPRSPWTWREVSGEGVVYSATAVHRGTGPAFVTPFLLAAVDLVEGATLLTHVVDVPVDSSGTQEPAAALIGRRVRVRFRSLTDTISIPEFVLAGIDGAAAAGNG